MDNYYTSIALLGLKDQNLPPFKEARLKRYNSIRKMIDLVETCSKLCPRVPSEAFMLNPNDPEWDDDMTYPVIQYDKFTFQTAGFGLNLFLYAYNYNNFTYNIRFRTLRYIFPLLHVAIFGAIYWDYKTQLLKVNLFDEYVQLRAKELVEQYEFLLEHDDIKRFLWWNEDLKETLCRVHRGANNHDASDFKDSELILQDFIRRYSNPALPIPLKFGEKASFLQDLRLDIKKLFLMIVNANINSKQQFSFKINIYETISWYSGQRTPYYKLEKNSLISQSSIIIIKYLVKISFIKLGFFLGEKYFQNIPNQLYIILGKQIN